MRSNTPDVAYALYFSGVDLESLAADLDQNGFHKKDVSVLLPQNHFAARTMHNLRMGINNPGMQQEVQEAFEWIHQFGSVIIPQVGVFDSRHEFTGTLFGTQASDSPCRTALLNLGIDRQKISDFQQWTKDGGIAVLVACHNGRSPQLAGEILEEAGADEVSGKVLTNHAHAVPLMMAS